MAAALIGAIACGEPHDRPQASGMTAAGGASADPRQCGLPGLAGLPPDTAAVRCAEWFVARNGYTDLAPVADSTQLASESIEFAPSVAELLASRRNTLGRRAAVVCREAPRGAGYTVGFAAPGDRARREGRAVTMDASFGALRVEHQVYLLSEALSDSARCHPAGG